MTKYKQRESWSGGRSNEQDSDAGDKWKLTLRDFVPPVVSHVTPWSDGTRRSEPARTLNLYCLNLNILWRLKFTVKGHEAANEGKVRRCSAADPQSQWVGPRALSSLHTETVSKSSCHHRSNIHRSITREAGCRQQWCQQEHIREETVVQCVALRRELHNKSASGALTVIYETWTDFNIQETTVSLPRVLQTSNTQINHFPDSFSC